MNIELKDSSHGPIYGQVKQQIETQITNKSVRSGESLPSPAARLPIPPLSLGSIQV